MYWTIIKYTVLSPEGGHIIIPGNLCNISSYPLAEKVKDFVISVVAANDLISRQVITAII